MSTIELEQYERIYNFLSSLWCSEDKLMEIKSVYSDIIDSRRRLHSIRTVKDLLQVLQKRDYISPQKIGALVDLAECFQGIPREVIFGGDSYSSNHNTSGVNLVHNTHNLRCTVLPRLPTDLEQRVYQVIASDIGQKWTDFARALRVPEGDIDNLHYTERNVQQRVIEILKYHQDRCDPRLWRTSLLDGLTEARRNDLRKKVQNIFDTYLP